MQGQPQCKPKPPSAKAFYTNRTPPPYTPALPNQRIKPACALACVLIAAAMTTGCNSAEQRSDEPLPTIAPHPTTHMIDSVVLPKPEAPVSGPRQVNDYINTSDYAQAQLKRRWALVQLAVAHHGVNHGDSFYGSRAYWHTNSTRGIGWALQFTGDLTEPIFVDGKGNAHIKGDVRADLEISGDAIVHILGDLDATLELKGVCEVVIAGDLTENATIICDGQLHLFVGGDSRGILGATQSATIIIDGDAAGTLQCSAPATTLTVTGDLSADLLAPNNKDAVLTLRVDGYAPTADLLDLTHAGFTRVNATVGLSDAPPGLYPKDRQSTRPTARWVVIEQAFRNDP